MGMTMQDMVKTLASLPEEQRETMMEERLKMFAEMGDEERLQAMRGMTRAVVSLAEPERKKLIRTRTRLLLDLPEDIRSRLMMTHMKALQGLSEQERMAEMQATQAVVGELPEPQRSMMQGMMEKMMGGMPMATGPGQARADARGPALRTVQPPAAISDRLAGWGVTVMWLTALAGVWVLVAPFILGFSGTAGTGNHVVFGIGIAALAGLVALSRQWVGWSATLTWIVVLAGIWLVISPWVLGYTASGTATGNAVLFGAVITILSGIVALARPQE